MKKSLLALFVIGVFGLFSSIPALASLSVGFVPNAQTINLGGTAAVDIVASFGQGEIVSAYDLDIAYDPSIVTATVVTFGTMLGGGMDSLVSASLVSPGLIDLAEVSLMSDADLASLQGSGPITLATLTFTGDNLGTSKLSFVNYGLYGNDVKGANNVPYANYAFTDGSLTVVNNPVPIPGAIWLFGSGLMGLAGLRRKFMT